MKRFRWMFYLFAAIGVVLLAVGAYLAQGTNAFVNRSSIAEGVVVEDPGRPVVRFRTHRGDEVEFVSTLGTDPPSYNANDRVEVYYDPDDPKRASINSFSDLWLGPLILGAIGLVFTGVGMIPLTVMRRRARIEEWVRANGQRIEGGPGYVELDTSITINGSHPYRIKSQWMNPATKRVHVFKSDCIWYDPSEYADGRPVAVWIDPQDPSRYAMETSFLPERAG